MPTLQRPTTTIPRRVYSLYYGFTGRVVQKTLYKWVLLDPADLHTPHGPFTSGRKDKDIYTLPTTRPGKWSGRRPKLHMCSRGWHCCVGPEGAVTHFVSPAYLYNGVRPKRGVMKLYTAQIRGRYIDDEGGKIVAESVRLLKEVRLTERSKILKQIKQRYFACTLTVRGNAISME